MRDHTPDPTRLPPHVRRRLEDAARQIRHLSGALETRAVIARAQGILMERHEIDADAAFTVLQRSSTRLGIPLRDVAANLEETRSLAREITRDRGSRPE